MLKSYRVVGWGGVGGPCDFSVSPSPFGLDFGTLDFGLRLDNNICFIQDLASPDSIVSCTTASYICMAEPGCSTALQYYNNNCRAMFEGRIIIS